MDTLMGRYLLTRDNDPTALQAKVLTKDDARRTAIDVAKLRGC
jgi:hypothetical protein